MAFIRVHPARNKNKFVQHRNQFLKIFKRKYNFWYGKNFAFNKTSFQKSNKKQHRHKYFLNQAYLAALIKQQSNNRT